MKCSNCNNEFIIDEQDEALYNRIKVPEPLWCPDCRAMRRLTFRNERSFYKRKCDLCNKDMISTYSEKTEFPVYCNKCWWSDKWDPLEYGQEYDFNKSFFEQFKELINRTPRVSMLITGNSVNSEYTNIVQDMKNCYLLAEADYDEDCMYSGYIGQCKDCSDCYMTWNSERSYELVGCRKCYGLKYSIGCESCVDSYFLRDCHNCQHCFGCVNLRNKEYHIFNKPYTKEEYFEKLKELNIGSYRNKEELYKKHHDFSMDFPRKFADIRKSERCTGNFIINCSECYNCFGIIEVKQAKNTIYSNFSKDIIDSFGSGYYAEILYECQCVYYKTYNCKFSNICFKGGVDLEYSDLCTASSNLFGCVSLNKKQYCILNKQYTKEQYEELMPKIKEQMSNVSYIDKKGRVYVYGEFFPTELSPFCYNETVAQEYFPLTKEQAIEQGYTWKDLETRDLKIDIHELPDHIKDVKDDIINKVIECKHNGECNEQCTTAFKIIPQELEFYRKHGLSLPRLCPNCRHYQRIKRRNPSKLWDRNCAKCNKDIKTVYAPDRPEIVYCEDCYNKEVN